MTRAQAAELLRRAGAPIPAGLAEPSASKFNARKKELDGITFDSTLEADAYTLLKHWERSGVIAKLELQPAFELQGSFKVGKKYVRSIKYIADFRVTDNDGTVRVIDTKGVRTAVFNVKLKMFQLKYPDVIFELWGRDVLKRMQ